MPLFSLAEDLPASRGVFFDEGDQRLVLCISLLTFIQSTTKPGDAVKLTFKVTPWAHQLEGIKRASVVDGFAFLFDPGCGKTLTSINTLRLKWGEAGRPMKTLIFCPPIVFENWRREILMHSNIPDETIAIARGDSWRRMSTFERAQPNIIITNYESLILDKVFEKMKLWKPEVLIFDESHNLKSKSAKRTRRAIVLSEIAKHKYLLTGTPLANTIEDYFSQFLIMDGGATFGTRIDAFRTQYFDDLNKNMPRHCYFPNRVPKMDALERIARAIAPVAMVAHKDDCMDLPPLVRTRIAVEMSAPQTKAYLELERDFVTELEEGKFVAADLVLTQGLRLQQIVTGYVPDEAGTVHEFGDNPRIAALKQVIEGLGEAQFCVWAVFQHNFKQIADALRSMNISFREIHGGTQSRFHQGCIDEFQEGKVQAIIGHPKSAGVGANLSAGSYSIFYSRSFSLLDDIQAEARTYRGGSERHEKITRIDLVTPGTIDETVLSALERKADIARTVLDYLKEKGHGTR